jgi:hypothetical protein
MKKLTLFIFVFISTLAELLATSWQAPSVKLLPGSQVFSYPISKARWLWYQDKSIKSQATAFYRYTIHLDEDVKSAYFYLLMDDKGTVKVNGKNIKFTYPKQASSFQLKIPKYDLTPALKKGKNVITFKVFNNVNTGGLFFNGQIVTTKGKKIPLVSNQNVKAISKVSKDWENINFDDSLWPNALEFGDALTSPWNTASNIIEFGLSNKEKQEYKKSFNKAIKISPSIAKEPIRKTTIDYSSLVPAIKVGDVIIPPILHKPGDTFMPERADITMKFAQTGIKWLELGVLDYDIIREKGFDFSSIDSVIRRTLNVAPNTYIGVCIRFSQRNYLWMKNNPDELIKYPTGPADQNNDTLRRRAPSMASEKYQAEMRRIIKGFFDYAKKQPWYSRIISCRVANGCFLEWHYYGMRRDMPDVSNPMIARFRKYLTKKYQNDASLQKAWQDKNVSLANALVPGVASRHGKGNFLRNMANGNDCQVMDYYTCLQQVIADTLLNCAQAVKESAPHILVGAYYGYVLQMNFPPEGQTILLDKVLSSPYIDFLSAPICYDHSRQPNSDGLKRTLPSIFARYKKLHIVEQDTRTHITYPKHYTPSHSAVMITRDTVSAWLDGCGTQLLSIHGVGQRHWMNSPEILTAIYKSISLWKSLYKLPAKKRTCEEIAVVFNTPEMFLHGYPTVEQQKQPIMLLTTEPVHSLIRSGYTFDLLDLPGFLASKNNYKVVIFLNTYTVDENTIAAIKKKIHQPNVVSIWQYAPGLVSKNGWSEKNASNLTGLKLKLISGGNVAIKGIALPKLSLSPRLAVVDSKAQKQLPYLDTPNYIGMAQKYLSNGAKVIFSGAPINNPALWHKLISLSKIKPISAPGNVILGFNNYILIPFSKKNSINLTLPLKAKKITELISGKNNLAGKRDFVIQSNQPAVYLIEW